ncbi:hypothetical protein Fcan01_15571 [Folsomia candida]|uniref:Ionotropic glutamate receptor C-terminal domain-containing protein n=1 Tax=Folsomia candida TaxID=158441 RepID=A0A226DYN4_FOLCA|nr:hypothetical protein Fcan01_15571 [Folsomia candida]
MGLSNKTFTCPPTSTVKSDNLRTPASAYSGLRLATRTPASAYSGLRLATRTPASAYSGLRLATRTPASAYSGLQKKSRTPASGGRSTYSKPGILLSMRSEILRTPASGGHAYSGLRVLRPPEKAAYSGLRRPEYVLQARIVLCLYKKFKKVNFYDAFCPWSFMLANIFEEAGYVPVQLDKQQFFRMVVGSWILMSVILTNCYNGLMISSLNSPLPKTNIPETFEDLICQDKQIIKSYEDRADLTDWIVTTMDKAAKKFHNPVHSVTCYKIFSTGDESLQLVYDTVIKTANYFRKVPKQPNQLYKRKQPTRAFIPMETIITLLFSEGYSFVPNKRNHSDEIKASLSNNEVVKCGKSALVSDAFDMEFRFNDLFRKYFWRKFYKGKDIVNYILVGWIFEDEGNSKVPQYFQSLFESGIQGRLDLEIAMRKYSRNSEYTIPKREDSPGESNGKQCWEKGKDSPSLFSNTNPLIHI